MNTFISILRGINVSGHKKIEMAGLKALYEALGFKEVVTFIQSGNVVFKTSSNESDNDLEKKIEEAILAKYAFEVPVIIRTADELKRIISLNPFINEPGIDVEKLHITFLSEEPTQLKVESIKNVDFSPDRFKIVDTEIFIYCPNGYGNTKLSNNFFEAKLKVTATTRNLKTTGKLLELAEVK